MPDSPLSEETGLYLLTAPGRALLAEAETLLSARADTLSALTRLRKSAAPAQAAAAWEMADLRRRGVSKFGPRAAGMFFVREALEQASGLATADYHAARMRAAGVRSITDLGGGIGGDALAFARAGLRVTLVERDPLRARFAGENARVHGFTEQIAVRQGEAASAPLTTDAAWLDPARRAGGRRVSDPEDYSPPLSRLHGVSASGLRAVGVKLSPAIDHALADPFGAELEFLSEGGECRESLLWLGAARSGDALRATRLTPDGPVSLAGAADRAEDWTPPTGGRYLYEPDPAVIRAHLVGTLAGRLGAAAVDPSIAYLLGDALVATPLADAYEVLARFPYGRKRLQETLAAMDVGRVVVKKRGFPLEPDAVRKSLKLRGSSEMIVVLARIGRGHEVFLCHLAVRGACG